MIYPEIIAKAKDKKIDYELSEVRLYHNDGIRTFAKKPKDLIGKVFVWNGDASENAETAGILCVGEHSPIESGKIEIIDVKRNSIKLKWSGEADVDWDEKYGQNVPFETEFSAQLAPSVIYCIIFCLNQPMREMGETVIEVTDLEELKPGIMEAWKKYKAGEDAFVTGKLHLKITHLGEEYLGEICFDNAPVTQGRIPLGQKFGEKGAVMTIHPECPRKIIFDKLEFHIDDFNLDGSKIDPYFYSVYLHLRLSKK